MLLTGSYRGRSTADSVETTIEVQENQGFPDVHLEQDNLLAILPDKEVKTRNFSIITHFITHV